MHKLNQKEEILNNLFSVLVNSIDNSYLIDARSPGSVHVHFSGIILT